MAFDYTTLRDETAEPLLAEYGKAGQIAVNVPATGNPWDSQFDSETTHDVIVLQTRFLKDNNQGTLVEANDVLFIVSTQGVMVDPQLAHRVVVGGVAYQVVRVDPLSPGATTLLWKVHGRK